MTNGKDRVQKVVWSDILMAQKYSDDFVYEAAQMVGPSTLPAKPAVQSIQIGGTWRAAKPEIYTVKIGGTWAADDTLVIGSTTFTAKATPSTNQFSAGGTGAVIVEDIKANNLAVTGFTISYSGDTITLTQTVPGTGDAPTVTPTSTAGTAVLANVQNYQAGDTLAISGTTYTCKAGASTSAGTTEFEPTATPAAIAKIIADDPLTISNFTVTSNGSKVVITQTTAGTGTLLTNANVTVTSSAGTATLKTEQEYVAAISSGDAVAYHIEPGEPVYLVSVDSDGVKTVAPVDNTNSNNINAFVGFVRGRHKIVKGETDKDVILVTGGCRLDRKMLPDVDQFGNAINWDYAASTLRAKAEEKDFKFGKSN